MHCPWCPSGTIIMSVLGLVVQLSAGYDCKSSGAGVIASGTDPLAMRAYI